MIYGLFGKNSNQSRKRNSFPDIGSRASGKRTIVWDIKYGRAAKKRFQTKKKKERLPVNKKRRISNNTPKHNISAMFL